MQGPTSRFNLHHQSVAVLGKLVKTKGRFIIFKNACVILSKTKHAPFICLGIGVLSADTSTPVTEEPTGANHSLYTHDPLNGHKVLPVESSGSSRGMCI